MKTLGDVLQLIGTLVTAGGLFYAWEKATRRMSTARSALLDIWTSMQSAWNRLTGQQHSVTVEAPTATAIAGAGQFHFKAVVQHQVDPTLSVEQQIEGLAAETRAIREVMAGLHEYISRVEEEPRIGESDVQAAVTSAVNRFESELKISTGQDFVVAIVGVVITVAGMVCGLLS